MKFIIILLSFVINAASFSYAKEFELHNSISKDGKIWGLYSSSTYKRGFFFKILEASLYIDIEHKAAYQFPSAVPIVLKLQYYRDIRAEKLVRAGQDILQDLYSPKLLDLYFKELALVENAMQSVKKGDFYELYYYPNHGIEIWWKDNLAVKVEGDDFAKLYLSIWLGDHEKTRSLKNDLLKIN